MNEFDIKAGDWDNESVHWERSEAIAKRLIDLMPEKQGKALEFGAGTGILSFMLKDSFSRIALMDSSQEMIHAIQKKIESEKIKNFKALLFDLVTTEYIDDKFDVVFTQMVLHHIADIQAIISKFYDLLNKGGLLAVADLYTEDGSFHGEGFDGHLGFDGDHLAGILKKTEFKNILHNQCFIIKKQIDDGTTKDFPVFLLTAIK